MVWRVYKQGTTTAAGTVMTVIDTTRKEADDFFNGMYIKMTTGPAAGQERPVNDWVKSTGTFTVSSGFSIAPGTGSLYQVGVYFTHDPGTVSDDNPPEVQSIKNPGNLPIILSYGKKARTLVFEGYIYNPLYALSIVEALYIIPLRNLVGHDVFLDADDTRYSGSWIFGIKFQESFKHLNAFKFTATLQKGSSYVVLI